MDELDDAILQYEHFDAECARLEAEREAAETDAAYEALNAQLKAAEQERRYWSDLVDELEQEVAYRNLREDRRDYYDSVL